MHFTLEVYFIIRYLAFVQKSLAAKTLSHKELLKQVSTIFTLGVLAAKKSSGV
jgi:hypothetical protein